ncbi:MAG: glycosyltransferase family 4 protein, partial [Bryobacteraceae bacterium]
KWWLWGASAEIRRLGADVFHGVNFEVPYVPMKPSVLTLHDLSPWMDPAWHTGADRVRRRCPPLIGLSIATMILTDSEAVRRQAMAYFRIHPSRIVAVPLAASSHFRPCGRRDGAPYLLFVGTLEPRKNVLRLIEAWRPVRDRCGVELVLAGRRREDFPPLAPEPGLRIAGEVADADLPALYSGALAFLYPSMYEGFGLPVLEAMQCGACVVTSTDPAIGEVAGEAALRLDPRDGRGWSAAMMACAAGGEWMNHLREKALERASRFSWERTARRTREVYVEALARFER